jgi:hypothetical protein
MMNPAILAYPYDTDSRGALVTGTVTFPPGRYGRRREPRGSRRVVPALLLVIVLAASVGIAVKLFRQYGNPAYRVDVTAVHIADTESIVVFRVTKPAGRPASCGVRASARDGAEVGRATVDVPAGGPDSTVSTVTYRLATRARAYAVDVPRCAAPAGE